jgi:hypothetical protein
MKNPHFPCKVAALYPDDRTASAAMKALDKAALEDVRVIGLAPDATNIDQAIAPETEAIRDSVARDTAAGGAAGIPAGAATAGMAAAMAPALFVSAPVVSALIVLGYGAMIGGVAGAIRGLRLRESLLAGLVKDALKAGCYVLIVHAFSKAAQQRAEAVIGETLVEQAAHT